MKKSILILSLLLGSFLGIAQEKQYPQAQLENYFFTSGQWANYGNDPGGISYSPLEQINTTNVSRLQPAWTYQTGELVTYKGYDIGAKAAFEATPIMVNGVLYFSTPTNRIIAIDAVTGKEQWIYDSRINLNGDYSEITSRGVSKWIDATLSPEDQGYMRILAATIDGRLIALDAKTGELLGSFGKNGTIDLTEGVGYIQVTSPPAVINDLIVIGSTMGDNQRFDYPQGVVRAFNAKTGELVWSWNPIPTEPSDSGYETWQGDKAHQTGAANAWAPLSADPERDLVFVPTSCPSPDYYGGERKGDNLYANSLVAIKASTGEVVWHFQTVHHDIWDYDLPAQPVLLNLEKEGKEISAVVVVTKMGHIFAFDRETGEAIFPIEERAVPQSDILGEQSAPTQPFPTVLPTFGIRELSADDAWGPTPEHLQKAKDRIDGLVNKGIFTPPSLQGTIVTPSNVGGMNWSGASFNPERNLLVTNTNRLAAVIQLHPRTENSPQTINEKKPRSEIGRQEGTPYLMSRDYLFTIDTDQGFMMQTQPPWGTLAAVDIKSGQLKWEVPLGFMMDPSKYPEASAWGSINLGGAITTAGGLIFIAATMDGYLRSFDTETGEVLWAAPLPAGGQATPMTYQVDGKQYVVIAAGGHGKLGTQLGDYVVAFAID